MTILIKIKKKSPMYPSVEDGKQAKRNHWYVTEIGQEQPVDRCWREWWVSKGLGDGNEHIKWRSTCIAEGCRDPFKPTSQFKVDFHLKGVVYHLQFTLAPTGPNK